MEYKVKAGKPGPAASKAAVWGGGSSTPSGANMRDHGHDTKADAQKNSRGASRNGSGDEFHSAGVVGKKVTTPKKPLPVNKQPAR